MKRGISTIEVVMSLGIMALMLAATVGAISLSSPAATPDELRAEFDRECDKFKQYVGEAKAAQNMRAFGSMRQAERKQQEQIDKITKLRKKCQALGVDLPW